MLERVGPYEVVRELARGGMGVVYVARDPGLERLVALKVVAPTGLDAEALARFRREGQAAARLRHPNIVQVHALGTLPNGVPYMVLDLVDGESLRARVVREGPLPPALAARLVAQVARAVEHAHGRGVLHRDLKPANVLVDRADGAPYLTDFGLARLLDHRSRVTATGEVMGTVVYMAPEQADGDHLRVGSQADVYGLGATLYELLTGKPPFHGLGRIAALSAVLQRAPDPPRALRPELDPALEAIVLRCLEKAPERRFAGAGALAEALEDWGATPRGAVARRAGRSARLTVVAGVVALASVGAALEREHARRQAVARAGAVADARAAALARERPRTDALLAAAAPSSALARAEAEALLAEAILAATSDPALVAELRARRALVTLRGHPDPTRPVESETLAEDVAALLARDPDDPLGRFGRLRLPPGLGGLPPGEDRAAALEDVLRRAPDLNLARLVRGWGRLGRADALAALEDADHVLAADRALADAHRLRGRALLLCGRRREAVDEALCAAALRPDDADGWLALADVALAAGDPAVARRAADRVLALRDDADALAARATVRLLEGDPSSAARDAERARQLAPDHAGAAHVLAEARLWRGPRAAAIEVARHGEPGLADAVLTRALAMVGGADLDLLAWRAVVRSDDRERLSEARDDVAAVLARDPTHPIARYARAQLLLHDGELAAAKAEVQALVAADDAFAEAHGLLAGLHMEARDRDEALRAVERCLALDPQVGKARVIRAGLRLAAGDAAGARADALVAAGQRPLWPAAWQQLAGANVALRDPGAGLEAANRAVSLTPDAISTRHLRAVALLALGDDAGALAEAERVHAAAPSDVQAGSTRMRALMNLGRHDEAATIGERLLELLPPGHPARPELERVTRAARSR